MIVIQTLIILRCVFERCRAGVGARHCCFLWFEKVLLIVSDHFAIVSDRALGSSQFSFEFHQLLVKLHVSFFFLLKIRIQLSDVILQVGEVQILVK